MFVHALLSSITLSVCPTRAPPTAAATAPSTLSRTPLGVFERAGTNVLDLAPHTAGPLAFSPTELAYGVYNDSYNAIGWDVLQVHGNPSKADCDSAFGAGYFEGAVTALRIEQNAVNSGVKTFNTSGFLDDFLVANDRYRTTMISLVGDAPGALPASHADRRLWYQHALLQAQLDGLEAGYNAIGRPSLVAAKTTSVDAPLTTRDFRLLQIGGDLEDLADFGCVHRPRSRDCSAPTRGFAHISYFSLSLSVFSTCNASTAGDAGAGTSAAETGPVFDPGRCSALIRLAPNNADLFVAQETWASLNSMLRMYKLYDLPFKMSDRENDPALRVPATRVSFSSYPGCLNSGDDFYVLSSGLIQQETTIGNSNKALASRFITPFSVLEWRRNIVANRLASSCDPTTDGSWSEWYRKENSGTYNNQVRCGRILCSSEVTLHVFPSANALTNHS